MAAGKILIMSDKNAFAASEPEGFSEEEEEEETSFPQRRIVYVWTNKSGQKATRKSWEMFMFV